MGSAFPEDFASVSKCGVSSLIGSSSNVFLCRDFEDCHIWKANSYGEFSCRPFHKALEDTQRGRLSNSLVWLGLAPPRVEAFCWLTVSGKASTVDKLQRRSLVLEDSFDYCVLCGKEKKNINHLFLHCEFAHFLMG